MKHPTHKDLQNPHYRHWKEFLNKSEQWAAEEIAEYQLSEMKRVIRIAYETPGYRRLYEDAGLAPDDLKHLDDVRRFPAISKELMRRDINDFVVETEKKTYVTTGGSTGVPFGFYRDDVSFARELASKAHQYHRIGWKEGDPQLVLRGLPIGTRDHVEFVPEFNELRCSSYFLVPESVEIYGQRAFEFKPLWLKCYPSSGYLFAKVLKENGISFPPIKGILCASENLYDYQVELLDEVFHARVFSHYGHYEMAVLAGFCEHENTYHVLPQYGYAELIDPHGRSVTEPGQMGEIVGTSFIMSVTPFVRYRTQDYAVLKGWSCSSCGRQYQVWERVEGRLQEFIVTGKNRFISMTAINMHDDIFDHVEQFQFYQEHRGKVAFRYIPKPSCNQLVVEDMMRRLRAKLGDDIVLEMARVSEIPLTGRGKHRFLIQELDLEIGDGQ